MFVFCRLKWFEINAAKVMLFKKTTKLNAGYAHGNSGLNLIGPIDTG